MADEKKYTSVSIPIPLYNKVKDKIKDTGFTSVSDYVVYVLRELMTEEDDTKEAFSKEDEEKVKSRLRSLGYIE